MYTKPRQERVAQDNLERQHYTVFFPQARVCRSRSAQPSRQTIEPLFPRYMFVRLKTGVDNFSKLRSTKGCMDLVKFGGKATAVSDALIELLQDQLEDDGILDLASLNTVPGVGQQVRLTQGPFEGLIGKIAQHKGADRVLILLTILGSERRVEVGVNQIEKNEC